MNEELLANIHNIGKSKGLNNSQINKAIKMLKSGKINTDNLIDTMVDSSIDSINISNPTREDLKAKLHKKIEGEKNKRFHKLAPTALTPVVKPEAPLATNKKQNKKKKEAKKLYELQKKYGTITMELYNNYLNELNNMKPTFELNTAEIAHKNHIQNIIKLYLKQQRNNEQTNEINIDLSELSDLSDSD